MLTDTGLAISTAHSRAETSHRDISKSNVMMTEQRDGSDGRWAVLNDWDHAKTVGTLRPDWIMLRTVRFHIYLRRLQPTDHR